MAKTNVPPRPSIRSDALIEVVHTSGQIMTLPYEGETRDTCHLRWPLVGLLQFRLSTGEGRLNARGWSLTAAGREALYLPPAPDKSPRLMNAKPKRVRRVTVSSAALRTIPMFEGES